jgi:hypothetical protein
MAFQPFAFYIFRLPFNCSFVSTYTRLHLFTFSFTSIHCPSSSALSISSINTSFFIFFFHMNCSNQFRPMPPSLCMHAQYLATHCISDPRAPSCRCNSTCSRDREQPVLPLPMQVHSTTRSSSGRPCGSPISHQSCAVERKHLYPFISVKY